MTISYTKIHDKFSCNGATTQFDFNWPVIEKDNLRVSIIETATGNETILTLNADYTVSLDNDGEDGGTVTTNTAYSSDYDLLIQRVTDQNQGTNYVDGDRFPASVHEGALDKLTMIVQELWDAIQRAWRLPKSEVGSSDLSFPHPYSRKNQMPAFDSDGNPVLIPVPEDVVQDKNFAVYYITCTGDYTLSEDDPQVELIDPNGANRAILLPDNPGKDVEFVVVNVGAYNSSTYLEVKISGDLSFFTRLYVSSSARFVYDTTNGTWSCIGSGFYTQRIDSTTYTSNRNVTSIGVNANASNYGVAMGSGADASNYGANVGNNGDGSSYGANVGRNGDTQSNQYAKTFGAYSRAERYGEFGQTADHRSICKKHLGQVAWQGQTTDVVETELYLHGDSDNRCVVLENSVIAFEIRVSAYDSTNNKAFHEKIEGTILRDGSDNTSIEGTNDTTVITNTTSGTPAVSVEADDTNEALVVKVTGLASTTIDWLADGKLVDCRVNL